MRKILLDTNAFFRLALGNTQVQKLIEHSATTYLSIISLGELYAGFRSGNNERKNHKLLSDFLNKKSVSVITVTEETISYYADIKHALKKKGKPIPDNDIWIAANTFETSSTLITFDRHFSYIPGLRIWKS